MKFEIPMNIKGSLPVPRAVICLLSQKLLTINDFGWYLILTLQADFGHKYKTYGVVTKSDKVIAEEFGCNPSTVFKIRKKLVNAGVLKMEGRKTLISNYDLFSRRDKTIVPIVDGVAKKEDKEVLVDYFINHDTFLKHQQSKIRQFQLRRRHLNMNPAIQSFQFLTSH